MNDERRYADDLVVAEARDQYLRTNGFALADYERSWVRIELGPLPVWIPNTRGRKRAVRLHDLHHLATGYGTDLRGEAEISAWELAAGCGEYQVARLLDIGGMALGFIIAPLRTLAAWRRGRRSRSLYDRGFGDDLLAMTVGELRQRLRLDQVDEPPSLSAHGGL